MATHCKHYCSHLTFQFFIFGVYSFKVANPKSLWGLFTWCDCDYNFYSNKLSVWDSMLVFTWCDYISNIGVFPKWNGNSVNSGNLLNHWSMNWGPVSHMCIVGAVVASWSLTQDVVDSNAFTVMANIFISEFNESIWEKLK